MKKGVYLTTAGVLLATSFPREIFAAEQKTLIENTVVEVEVSGQTESIPAPPIEEVTTEVYESVVIKKIQVLVNQKLPSSKTRKHHRFHLLIPSFQ